MSLKKKKKTYMVYQAETYPSKELRRRNFLVQIDLMQEKYSCMMHLLRISQGWNPILTHTRSDDPIERREDT